MNTKWFLKYHRKQNGVDGQKIRHWLCDIHSITTETISCLFLLTISRKMRFKISGVGKLCIFLLIMEGDCFSLIYSHGLMIIKSNCSNCLKGYSYIIGKYKRNVIFLDISHHYILNIFMDIALKCIVMHIFLKENNFDAGAWIVVIRKAIITNSINVCVCETKHKFNKIKGIGLDLYVLHVNISKIHSCLLWWHFSNGST